ncbi:MAG: ATP-dependent DNA helicase RecG [Phycisphaerales bacterium]|nr:ATP-dependent DNA helicase RecG [Phycisphaerales bacterium]
MPTGDANPSPKPPPIALTAALSTVRGIRTDRAEGLARLGIHTVADLIRHLPMRYERLEPLTPIGELKPGVIGTVSAEITATRIVRAGKRPRFEAVLADHTGRLDLVFFNATYLQGKLFPGLHIRVQGDVRQRGPGLQMANPKWWKADIEDPGVVETIAEARIRPVYSASEQVPSAAIEQTVALILTDALAQIDDHLSPEYRAKRSLPELREAYRMAHAPANMEETKEARRRLAFDELLMLQLGVFLRRQQTRSAVRAPKLLVTPEIDASIRARFPFPLTGAQDRVVREIAKDLRADRPANRLIQGDVGSGKTVVALYAMLAAVACDAQAAIMAPTELLAEQHYLSISRMLEGSKTRVELLIGAMTEADKLAVLARLAAGTIDILIGTHALLTDRVRFANLAVAVIDEQHRFGVHQRAALRSKGEDPASPDAKPAAPHIIVMTATPIPRTLALTLLGDLDVSIIDELPPGRTPIITRVVPAERSAEVYTYARKRIDAGEQVYVVTPAIDTGASATDDDQPRDTDLNDLRTVLARLEQGEFAGCRIAALHGRLKRATREATMHRFRDAKIDALIATTVIEVGVDVSNATVMIIEHADRFGLAQLHQLRGRVGRGGKQSLCVLLASPPPLTPEGEARLAAMAATGDGFEIAEKDLELRGPGEVFGMRQAGAPPFRVADLMRDRELLALARRDAKKWIDDSPTLHADGEDLLRKRLLKLHGQWLGLGDMG